MKNLVVTVFERNGDYEYNHKVLTQVDEKTDLDEFADNYAKDWYGSSDTADKHGEAEYFLNGGVVFVSVSAVECTDEEYKVLKKFI